MNKQEIGQLLTMAALVDNRTVTTEACLMWHEVIGHLNYEDSLAAVKAHFRESDEWLMPRHVVSRVRLVRAREAPFTMSLDAPDECAPGAHYRFPDGTCLHCKHRLPQLTDGATHD